jgi:hypothetical protein
LYVSHLKHQTLLTSARAQQKRDLQICSAQMLMQVSALSIFGCKVEIRITENEEFCMMIVFGGKTLLPLTIFHPQPQ